MTDERLKQIVSATENDDVLSKVKSFVLNGWPTHNRDVPEEVKKYYSHRAEITTLQDLLVFGTRVIIPSTLHNDMLSRLHTGHQGINKIKALAATSIWWPSINRDIEATCKQCVYCKENRPAQRHSPLMTTPLPDHAWSTIGIDLCEYEKRDYLIVVDYYSRYIEIVHMPDTTSATVILKLKSLFAHYGIPLVLRSDGGRQFTSFEFVQFANEHGFTHNVSSPYHSQSNGMAESAVKIAKSCLKQADPATALMMYRATPHSATGQSPARLMFGRDIRTLIPIRSSKISNSEDDTKVRKRDAQHKALMAAS